MLCGMHYRARYTAKANTDMANIVYDGSGSNSWSRGTNGRSKQPALSNTHPNSWQPTLMRPIVMEPNGSATNKSQKYYVVDQDYMNTAGLSNA